MPEIDDVLRTRILEAFKDWVAAHHGDTAKGVPMENASISRAPDEEAAYIVKLNIPQVPNTIRARVMIGPGSEITVHG